MVGGQKSSPYVPDRGDIVWLEFTPQAGHEQAGRRPALVLSPISYNSKTSLMLCCPITNQLKGYPFEVSLPANSKTTGVVLADQVKSLDWNARAVAYEEQAPPQVIVDVLAKVSTLL